MSESWPPDDDPAYPDDRQYRPSPPSHPRQPPRDPRSGERYPDPRYGAWGPPSGGYGQQQRGGWGPPSGGAPGQQQGGGWGPPSGGGWGAPSGASGPRGAQSYPPYPPQPSPYPPPYPPQYAPYPPQQAPSYAGRNGDPYARGGPFQPDEPPRSRVGAAALGIVLVVLVLLGVGGTYVLTHTPRPRASAVVQQTANPTGGPTAIPLNTITDATAKVQFGVPQGWTTTGTVASTQGFTFKNPNGDTIIAIAAISVPSGSAVDPVGAAKGGLAGAADYTPVNYDSGPTNVSLAGATWTQMSGTFTRSSTQLHGVVLVTIRNGSMYLLFMLAKIEAYDTSTTRYLQPVEQSFAFLP